MILNWTGFDRNNPAHVARVALKLESYLSAPDIIAAEQCRTRGLVKEFTPQMIAQAMAARRGYFRPGNIAHIKASVKEFTTKADTVAWLSVLNPIEFMQTDLKAIDTGWAAAFDLVDLRGTFQSGIDIPQATSGLTFSKILTGQRAQVYAVSGTNLRINCDLYGGGLGFERIWWDDQQYYKVDAQAADFKAKEADAKATVMYALITATANVTAYATSDSVTINNGVRDLIVNNDGVTPGVATEGTTFLLYHNPAMTSRVMAALATVTAYTSQKIVTYNVKPVSSPKISASYLGWLVAPGGLNKYIPRMDLTLLSETDITMFAETVVGWTRYGGYVNSVQVQRLAAS